MRSQLEVARTQTQASEKVNQEIESIKMFLADTEINFSEYNEIVVRKLIECIRVMPDGNLVIVLKGGMTIEEQFAALVVGSKISWGEKESPFDSEPLVFYWEVISLYISIKC